MRLHRGDLSGRAAQLYRKESNGEELFIEQDYEDGLLGGYFLSNRPMHFTSDAY